ncbi:MAG: glycosyltransferase family 2 protein [Thermoplasmata archaeon]
MGRILVFLFLGTVGFALLTFLIAFIHLVRDLIVLVDLVFRLAILADPPDLPSVFAFGGIWFQVAVYYFFIVGPIGIAALLILHFVVRTRSPRWERPAEIDWTRQQATVLLTAYDDEASVGPSVDEFIKQPQVSRVVVIDNNSKDRTTQVAQEHGATVIRETQQGYGFACMAGLRYALRETTDEFIVLCEGDMTFFGTDLAKFLPYLADCDMVIGTRNTRTLTREGSQMDWFMTWGNLFLALLIRLRYWDWAFLGRVQLTDVGCTFRAMRRDALARILDQLSVGSDHFSPHMILVALRDYQAITEVPINFRSRVGRSKGASGNRWKAIKVGLVMLGSITVH